MSKRPSSKKSSGEEPKQDFGSLREAARKEQYSLETPEQTADAKAAVAEASRDLEASYAAETESPTVEDYLGQLQGHLDACESSLDDDVPHLLRALLASNLAILSQLQVEND
jgi:hypothetical protein